MPRPGASAATGTLARLAEVAWACARTNDLPALIELVGSACREAAGGREWRFLTVQADSGALTLGAPREGARAVLPEPGGALEWLLAHEVPLVAYTGTPGGPTLELPLWSEAPAAVVGWPVASGDLLRGLLVVSFPEGAAPEGEGLATARVACDQLALALERHALAEQVRRQHALMSQLEERAQAGEASFSELIAVVAHEIRTPLTSIKAYTETLIDAPATEFEARRSFLTVIDEECDRLARLVSDALDLSRLEAGHRALKLRTIAPSAFVADLLTTLGPEATRQGVVLESDVDAALGAIEGDPDLLKQLMLNLVGNALKFSPQGGKVVLRAQGEGAEWRLEVEDAGVGIPEDQLDRVFERFYRVELKGGRRVPGTGLGLAIARHIVDLHDGVISAKNAPARGSIFSVRLPVRQLAPESVRAVTRSLGGRGDVKRLLETAVAMVSDVMGAEIVSVLLVDPDSGDLKVAAARGLDASVMARRLPYRGSVAGAAMRAGQSLLVDNVETDRRIHKKSHPQYFTKSLVCAPLTVAGETVGVFNANNKVSREDFDEHDRALLATLAARLAAMLERAHAYPDSPAVVADACETLEALARTRRELLAPRRELARHAFEIARRFRLEPAEATRVALMAGASGDEAASAELARDPVEPEEAAQRARILAARGERFDGTGWPRGLAGDAIPAGGRILAVLDAFETLTRGRAYRPALPTDAALAALAAQGGRAFDPAVVAALRGALFDDARRADHRLPGQEAA